MSAPTRGQILAMDYAWQGLPFVRVAPVNDGANITNLLGMNMPFQGLPFVTVWSYGMLKYWDGAAWTAKPLKYWDGANQTPKPLKVWEGTTWLTVQTS